MARAVNLHRTDRIVLNRTFMRIVEAGSFSRVAEETGTTQPTISKQIAALEAHLGVQLLVRSTRKLTLTDEGSRYYDVIGPAIDAIDAAEAEAQSGSTEVRGLVRFSCPIVFGSECIIPYLPSFLEANPKLSLRIAESDAFVDPIGEGNDLAIRIGELPDSTLRARRIGDTPRSVVASPSYVQRFGEPSTIDDLRNHECLVFNNQPVRPGWGFEIDGKVVTVPVDGRFATDVSLAMRSLLLSGMGLAMVPTWSVASQLADGSLVQVMKDHRPTTMPIHLLFPPRSYVPAKVGAFADHLTTIIRERYVV